MSFAMIFRILGLLLMVFSLTLAVPIVIALVNGETDLSAFISAFLITLATGFLIWLPFHRTRRELRTRDGFIITALFWTVLSLFGALPFHLAPTVSLSITDAVFEAVSGLTTTGATVITGIDELPMALLYYRQQLQWLGGMGIIVLAVAILPMLGIGGMQLYRAETPGPVKDTKLTPRITETAKALWYIYASITFACALAYWLAGMSIFDAICHSFSTVSTGGLSTHDASIGYFDNPVVEIICVVFMLLGAINFALHFLVWQNRSLLHFFKDQEFQFLIMLLSLFVLICTCALTFQGTYSLLHSFRAAGFEVVSIATSSGFATADFSSWAGGLPFLLFVAAFIGGCSGSTGGGMKVVRVLLLVKQGIREVKRLIHPNGVFVIKFGTQPVSERVIEAVWGFFSVYMLVFVLMMMALMASGLDQVTSWSAVAATLNNTGPGLGDVAVHYGDINNMAKWVLCLSMLLGRLEVFTLLVLFSPMFWRK